MTYRVSMCHLIREMIMMLMVQEVVLVLPLLEENRELLEEVLLHLDEVSSQVSFIYSKALLISALLALLHS